MFFPLLANPFLYYSFFYHSYARHLGNWNKLSQNAPKWAKYWQKALYNRLLYESFSSTLLLSILWNFFIYSANHNDFLQDCNPGKDVEGLDFSALDRLAEDDDDGGVEESGGPEGLWSVGAAWRIQSFFPYLFSLFFFSSHHCLSIALVYMSYYILFYHCILLYSILIINLFQGISRCF